MGIGLVHFIPSMTTAPIYYGTPENGWEDAFFVPAHLGLVRPTTRR